MSQIKVMMVGAAGKMGRRIINFINEDSDTILSAAIEHSSCPLLGQDAGLIAGCGELGVKIQSDILAGASVSDVIIDFTGAEATFHNLPRYLQAGKPILIGSTGFSSQQVAEIGKIAEKAPFILAANTSLGVNLTLKVLEMVSKTVGDRYDIEIIEAHHRLKKDAPSGTAMKMAEVITNSIGRDMEKDLVYARHGLIGARTDKEIGMQTIRAGDIVGEHTVMFCGNGERIEITHKAHTRDTFAKGAVTAAKWLYGKEKGSYSMFDVLGL
ncbi:MAG: 4-hydroxy-tetrahydrodipicolinate reductase [Calditerrivibrio sp.]|nr:4-hydroxy-tetrahydrodipicolinate reductase [Calditerrivibrio sp.]